MAIAINISYDVVIDKLAVIWQLIKQLTHAFPLPDLHKSCHPLSSFAACFIFDCELQLYSVN